MTLLQDIALGC